MSNKQYFVVDKYHWHVHIYYTVSEVQKIEIMSVLKEVECNQDTIDKIGKSLERTELATGFCYSNFDERSSILVIHKSSSIGEFINTFEHEKNHLEMHICEAMDINPYGEEASYLSGDLAQLIVEKVLCTTSEL